MKNAKLMCEKATETKKQSKKIGIAKEQMKDFDISLEELDSIGIPDFDN